MKNNNLVKILIVISVLLAIGFISVSARLITIQKTKDPLSPIVDNNNDNPDLSEKPIDPSNPQKPDITPPGEKDPEKPKDQDEIVTTKYISKERAIEIAIAKVGDGARVMEVDADLEDNPPKYEIELILGVYEYEVEIHAITGAIIDFDKDDLD